MNRAQNSSVTPQPNRRGVKTLIATASLAATLGGWAMLSAEREPVQAVKVAPTATIPRPTAIVFQLPPLPTLVPSLAVVPTTTVVIVSAQIEPTSTPIPQPTLRVVSQPPPQRVVVLGGGGDGGSGGGSQPAAQTRSSR